MEKAHVGSAKRNSDATQPYYKPDRNRRKPAGKARNPKPEPEFRMLGLLRDSGFLWCLDVGAWCLNRVLFNLRRLRSNRVGWQGWSVSRIKFCDTAVVENLRYFQLRTSAKKSVKSAPSAVKFFSGFDFRVSDFSGAWMLELGA
jgi:hypothetical protein